MAAVVISIRREKSSFNNKSLIALKMISPFGAKLQREKKPFSNIILFLSA